MQEDFVETFLVTAHIELSKQNPMPVQCPKTDISKNKKAKKPEKVAAELKKLNDGAGCSRAWLRKLLSDLGIFENASCFGNYNL